MKKKLSTFLAQKIPVSSGLYLHIELSPLLIQDWSADPERGAQGLSCLTCAHLPPACLSSVWFLHALSVLWIHIHRCISFTSWAFPVGNPSGRVSCPFLSYLFPYQLCEHFFYDRSYLALCGRKLLMTSLWLLQAYFLQSAFNLSVLLCLCFGPLLFTVDTLHKLVSPLSPHHSSESVAPWASEGRMSTLGLAWGRGKHFHPQEPTEKTPTLPCLPTWNSAAVLEKINSHFFSLNLFLIDWWLLYNIGLISVIINMN